MDTSCDGSTYDREWNHAEEYFNNTWDLNWRWSEQTNVAFETCEELLEDDQTFVYAGQSEWSAYVKDHFPQANMSIGKVGHCVVGFGKVISAMTGERFLLVMLGWGKNLGNEDDYPGSKWINFDAIRDTKVAYVQRF